MTTKHIGENIEKYYAHLYGVLSNKKLKLKIYNPLIDAILDTSEIKKEKEEKDIKNESIPFPKIQKKKEKLIKKKQINKNIKRTGNLLDVKFNKEKQIFIFEFDEIKEPSLIKKVYFDRETLDFIVEFNEIQDQNIIRTTETKKERIKFLDIDKRTKQSLLTQYRKDYFELHNNLLDEKGKKLDELLVIYFEALETKSIKK